MRRLIWKIILIIKIILSSNNYIYEILRALGFYNPGPRNKSQNQRQIDSFNKYYIKAIRHKKVINNILELGPGSSNLSYLPAAYNKINKLYLVDREKCRHDYTQKNRIKNITYLKYFNKDTNNYVKKKFNEGLFRYCEEGLESLRCIEPNTFDFIYSHSVMQHIKLDDIDKVIKELYRISLPGSIHIHYIDQRDCFSYSLNNLRFNKKYWESQTIQDSGFYTNRIRTSEFIEKFINENFTIVKVKKEFFSKNQIKKENVSKDIKHISDDLMIKVLEIVLKKDSI